MKNAEEWIEHLDFGLFGRISRRGADPLLFGETLKVIKQIQQDALGLDASDLQKRNQELVELLELASHCPLCTCEEPLHPEMDHYDYCVKKRVKQALAQ